MSKSKKQVPLKIIAKRKENQRRIYSNYVEITATNLDVSIKFCDVKPPSNDQEANMVNKEERIEATVEAEIVLPKDIAKAFLSALNSQLNVSEE
jgi:hypothetical protein